MNCSLLENPSFEALMQEKSTEVGWKVSIKNGSMIVIGKPSQELYLALKVKELMQHGKDVLKEISILKVHGISLEEFGKHYTPEVLEGDFHVHAESDNSKGLVVKYSRLEKFPVGSVLP